MRRPVAACDREAMPREKGGGGPGGSCTIAAREREAMPRDGVGAKPVRAVAARDRGTMTMELAILAPVLVAFFMLMVGLGRVVEAQSQVDGAARDAARAASVSRSRAGAVRAASEAAGATLSGTRKCRGAPRTSVDFGEWRRGGQVSVSVRCDVEFAGLSLIGFAPSKEMTGRATAPLDTLRRIDDPVGAAPEER